MRVLIDNSLSWRIGRDLRAVGHDAVHVADLNLAKAADRVIFERAVSEKRIILTQDSDFGPIHASATTRVGVALFKLSDGRPSVQAEVFIENTPELEPILEAAGFVIIDDRGLHVQDGGEPGPIPPS
jgi:predicted nuclease of predicted toxin-antitoxin system